MTFEKIIEKFKKHSYIRRECRGKNLFVQLRDDSETPLIRMVQFVECDSMNDTVSMKAMRMTGMTLKQIQVLNNDIRFSAEDILASDWSIG
jgi:hypothetical protein